jgi:hypothetical protein
MLSGASRIRTCFICVTFGIAIVDSPTDWFTDLVIYLCSGIGEVAKFPCLVRDRLLILGVCLFTARPVLAQQCPQGPGTVTLWPSQAARGSARQAASIKDGSTNATYCVLELGESDSARAEHCIASGSDWAMFSVPGGACQDTDTECLQSRSDASSIVYSSSTGTIRRLAALSSLPLLSPNVSKWLQSGSPQALGSIASGVLEETKTSRASGHSTASFWTDKTPSSARRVLLVRENGGACSVRWTRMQQHPPDPAPVAKPFPDLTNTDWVSPDAKKSPFLDRLARRTVRIQYRDRSGGFGACTGFLLAPAVVLTAKHCVKPTEGRRETPNCVDNPTQCASYVVDIDYRARGEPLRGISQISIPVRQATAPLDPVLDYALLYLHEHPRLKALSGTPVEGQLTENDWKTAMQDRSFVMLGHPESNPLIRSECSDARDENVQGDHVNEIHRCFTAPGSSGALLWRRNEATPMPYALHSQSVNECQGEPYQHYESDTDRLALIPKNAAAQIETLFLRGKPCVGVAVSAKSIYNKLCSSAFSKTECEAFERGVLGLR